MTRSVGSDVGRPRARRSVPWAGRLTHVIWGAPRVTDEEVVRSPMGLSMLAVGIQILFSLLLGSGLLFRFLGVSPPAILGEGQGPSSQERPQSSGGVTVCADHAHPSAG